MKSVCLFVLIKFFYSMWDTLFSFLHGRMKMFFL